MTEYCLMHGLMQPDLLFALPDAFVPHGSHAELLALEGRYRALYDLQTRPTDMPEAAQ